MIMDMVMYGAAAAISAYRYHHQMTVKMKEVNGVQ